MKAYPFAVRLPHDTDVLVSTCLVEYSEEGWGAKGQSFKVLFVEGEEKQSVLLTDDKRCFFARKQNSVTFRTSLKKRPACSIMKEIPCAR